MIKILTRDGALVPVMADDVVAVVCAALIYDQETGEQVQVIQKELAEPWCLVAYRHEDYPEGRPYSVLYAADNVFDVAAALLRFWAKGQEAHNPLAKEAPWIDYFFTKKVLDAGQTQCLADSLAAKWKATRMDLTTGERFFLQKKSAEKTAE